MAKTSTSFKKGQGGRKKGSGNKVSGELRQTINCFLEKNFEKIAADFMKMKPRERAKLYTDLLQYGLPKLQATSLDIDFEKLSDEQLDYIIDKLKIAGNE